MGTTSYVLFGNKADSGIWKQFSTIERFGDLLAVVPCFCLELRMVFWRECFAAFRVEDSYGVVNLQKTTSSDFYTQDAAHDHLR